MLVESKSGQKLVSYDSEALRCLLRYDIASMQQNGFDPSIVREHQGFNDKLESAFRHPDVSEYLSDLTAENIYFASGVRVLTLDSIKQEIQQLEPGALLFQYGYLPIASSIGGNIICFHLPTNQVVWADHGSFGTEEISFENRLTGEWEYIPFSPENIQRALVPLATNLEAFLFDLLTDKMEKHLDELD